MNKALTFKINKNLFIIKLTYLKAAFVNKCFSCHLKNNGISSYVLGVDLSFNV